MSWTRIKVGKLLATKPRTINPARLPNERFTLYSINAFDRGTPDIVAGNAIGSSKQILSPGDVLLSKIVPHIRRCWVVGIDTPKQMQIGSTEWMVFRSDHIDPRYLSKVLVGDEFHQAFMRTVAGVGGSLLRARPAAVAEIEIPVPPTIDEQKRIAAVLDMADALRRQRQGFLQLTEKLLQSVFNDCFGDLTGDDLREYPFEELALPGRGMFSNGPFGSDLLTSELQDTGVAVIYIRDIRNGEFAWKSNVFVTTAKAVSLPSCEVVSIDLLIAKVGDPPGVAALYPAGRAPAIITQDVIRVRVNPALAQAVFLQHFLNSDTGRRLIQTITVKGTRSRFSLRDLKKLRIPIPPAESQAKFANAVTHILEFRDAARDSNESFSSLFLSLQQRAFRGELDLRRIKLDAEVQSPAVTPMPESATTHGRYKRPGIFIASPEIEAQMMALEAKLDTSPDDSIPWSDNYFKFRTLSQILKPPFSFAQIWEEVSYDMAEALYEDVKDKVFEYVKEGRLEQRFDETRKEIVFYPRP